MNGKVFFLNNDGTTLEDGWQEIENESYYFESFYVYQGIKKVGDNYYYFNDEKGNLEKGWIRSKGKKYYSGIDDGILLKGPQVIDNKTYYFDEENFQMFTGFRTIDDKKYYYDKEEGAMVVNSTKIINGNEYEFAKDGKLTKIQYIPTYYNQKDTRWSSIRYGRSTLGSSGCAPTSMAMAFHSILEKTILPNEVADYLYYQTEEYNKYTSGTSGLGIIAAAKHYGIKVTPIKTKKELESELNNGKICNSKMESCYCAL